MMYSPDITGTWREENSGLIDSSMLISTVFVARLDPDTDEAVEPLYNQAGKYAGDVQSFMAGFTTDDFPTNDLMTYFSLSGLSAAEASIRKKIKTAIPSVCAHGELLFAVLKLDMTADLTNGELELFQAQIERQYENGWGGALEEASIITASGDKLAVCLWQSDMEFYRTEVTLKHLP